MRVLLSYEPSRAEAVSVASALAEALAEQGVSIDIRPADLAPSGDYDACVVIDAPGKPATSATSARRRRTGPVFHIEPTGADATHPDPDRIRAWARHVAEQLDTVAA